MSEAVLEQRPESTAVTGLDVAIWHRLGQAKERGAFATAWLTLQCRAIEGTVQGLVMMTGQEHRVFEPAATWPDGAGKLPHLVDAARLALVEKAGIVRTAAMRPDRAVLEDRSPGETGPCVVAYPVLVDGAVEGAVALALSGLAALDPRGALRQLQWGIAGLREHVQGEVLDGTSKRLARGSAALDLMSMCLDRTSYTAAALAVVTEIAMRFRIARVSLGFVERGSVRVATISHTSRFRRQMNLVACLQAAMNEAVDQRSVILYPPPEGQSFATTAHLDLSRLERDATILSIPIFKADRFVGAMTFERPRDEPFDSELVQILEAVTAATGSILEEQRQNDRWIGTKIGASLKRQLVRLFGPGRLARKLTIVLALAAAAFFYFAKSEYRVDAEAQIEGIVRRAVVASYDGFLSDASVRAGDTVKKGQVIATLDDRDLSLERLRWITERQQRLYEYDKALAARQPAAINVTRSQIEQAEAQIKLLDEQLSRLSVTAPIDGLVVSGDLSQLIGASVNRGQMLFEIAPLDAYRAILSVDERQIGAIKIGQTGELVTNALPDDHFAFAVDKITPIAEAKAGRNAFKVEGRLTQTSDRLRPGMDGVAKVDIGESRLIWIWTRSLQDWARITMWQWFG